MEVEKSTEFRHSHNRQLISLSNKTTRLFCETPPAIGNSPGGVFAIPIHFDDRLVSTRGDRQGGKFGIESGRLYSTNEAAELLKISRKTLQNWRWAGSPIAYTVIGRRTVRYLGSSLIELIERGQRHNTSIKS